MLASHIKLVSACQSSLSQTHASLMGLKPHVISGMGRGLENERGLDTHDSATLDKAKSSLEDISKKYPRR
jgi:hypothetical protein